MCATREKFDELVLTEPRFDPVASIKRHFFAAISPHPEELKLVEPVMPFSRADPRVIEAIDVISSLDQRPNLLDLTPAEFESFIQNLWVGAGKRSRPHPDWPAAPRSKPAPIFIHKNLCQLSVGGGAGRRSGSQRSSEGPVRAVGGSAGDLAQLLCPCREHISVRARLAELADQDPAMTAPGTPGREPTTSTSRSGTPHRPPSRARFIIRCHRLRGGPAQCPIRPGPRSPSHRSLGVLSTS